MNHEGLISDERVCIQLKERCKR